MLWFVSVAGSLAFLLLLFGLPIPSDSAQAAPANTSATGVADVAKVNADAQKLTDNILADETFMKTLPKAQPGKPLSAEKIDKASSLIQEKIASIRGAQSPGLTTNAKGYGILGLGINVVKTLGASANKEMDREEAAKAATSLIPIVGAGVGLGIGIKNNDPESIAVNSIALGALIIGAAIPVAGEVIGIGIVAYVAVKGLISWWKSTDAEERECLFGIVAIYRAMAHPEQTQCHTYYKKWFNAVVSFFTNVFASKTSGPETPPEPAWVNDPHILTLTGTDGLGQPVPWWAAQGNPRLPEPTPDGLRATASAAKAAADQAAAAQAASDKADAARRAAADKGLDIAKRAHDARIRAAFYTEDAASYSAAIKEANLGDAALKDARDAYYAAVKDATAKAVIAKDAAAKAVVAKDAAAKDGAGS